MINPRELRIRNLVYKKYSNDNIKIWPITGYDLWHSEQLSDVRHLVEWRSLSPIPITEEWLVKLGITELYYGSLTLINNRRRISLEKEDNIYSVQINEEYEITRIEYVHQLQNIYFALKGEELEIK